MFLFGLVKDFWNQWLYTPGKGKRKRDAQPSIADKFRLPSYIRAEIAARGQLVCWTSAFGSAYSCVISCVPLNYCWLVYLTIAVCVKVVRHSCFTCGRGQPATLCL